MLRTCSKSDRAFPANLFETFQPIHQEIREKEPTYAALMAAGEQLKETSQLPADQENLQEKLDNMRQRWTELNTTSDVRTNNLEKAVKLTTEYQEQRGHFAPWLDSAERRADAIHLTCDSEALETNKQHVEVFIHSTISHLFVRCCFCFYVCLCFVSFSNGSQLHERFIITSSRNCRCESFLFLSISSVSALIEKCVKWTIEVVLQNTNWNFTKNIPT